MLSIADASTFLYMLFEHVLFRILSRGIIRLTVLGKSFDKLHSQLFKIFKQTTLQHILSINDFIYPFRDFVSFESRILYS